MLRRASPGCAGDERKSHSSGEQDWVPVGIAGVAEGFGKSGFTKFRGQRGRGRPPVANWIECLGTRKQPDAPIAVGLAHAIVCCMGREAERTGKKVTYDATARKIVEA